MHSLTRWGVSIAPMTTSADLSFQIIQIQEVVALIAALLNDTSCDLTTDDLDLLQDDTIVFKNNLLDYIGPAISHEICNTRKILRNIATPGAENSESHKARTEISTQKPLLSQELALRISELRVKQQFDIPSAHARLNSMVNEVLAAYNSLVEATIQILERVKHGTLARATKAQAEHLSTVARGMDKKVTIMRLQTLERVYSPEVQDALMNYSQHLQDARIRLSEKERASLQQLDQYESQGEAMKEIAKRFGAILKDCENVKAEIRRLGGDP